MSTNPRIGFVGLGAMGGPMAGRLLTVGYDVVVFDLDEARVAELVERGAEAAESPAQLVGLCDEVHTCLPSEAAVRAVLLDPDGILGRAKADLLVVEHSTVSVGLSQEIAAASDAAGLLAVDAPVSTMSGSADDGALTIMVGGSEAAYERALPVLGSLGKSVVRCGPAGAGTAAKVATQYIGICNLVASMEGLLLAEANGVDLAQMAEVGPGSLGGSAVFEYALDWIREHDVGIPGEFRGVVSIFAKDISLGVDAARKAGSEHQIGEIAAGLFQQAFDEGKADWRWTSALAGIERPADA